MVHKNLAYYNFFQPTLYSILPHFIFLLFLFRSRKKRFHFNLDGIIFSLVRTFPIQKQMTRRIVVFLLQRSHLKGGFSI
jgi:hypothetical protein